MWITEYREKLGMNTEAFAHALSVMGAQCRKPVRVSEPLLLILENRNGAVTHPRIANLIARACGATPDQRDMIVHPKHRGRWHGVDAPKMEAQIEKMQEKKKHPWSEKPTVVQMPSSAKRHLRGVVMINRYAEIEKRFESAVNAAARMGLSETAVKNRCNRTVICEFEHRSATFRWADEWSAMSRTEQLDDIERAMTTRNGHGHTHGTGKTVVMIDIYGHERIRYPSMHAAAKDMEVDIKAIRMRCNRLIKQEFAPGYEVTFRYAIEWDNMDRRERMLDLKGMYYRASATREVAKK